MELRKDYLLDRFVFIATNRSRRPKDFVNPKSNETIEEKEYNENCPFCRGNEGMTPPEIGRINGNDGWELRWFENKFPITKEDGEADINTDDNFFAYSNAFGIHEVVVETPKHNMQLWDSDIWRISNLLRVFMSESRRVYQNDKIRYVLPFKNHGKEAGTSLAHSHSQIIGMNHIPKEIYEKTIKSNRYGSCEYCRIISIERNSARRIIETGNFVSFTPYASINNYEALIFPKKHVRFLEEIEQNFDELSEHILFILKKLKLLDSPYNIELIQSPKNLNLHLHIEIHPRLSIWGGVELSGSYVNVVAPEDAALFYRGGSID